MTNQRESKAADRRDKEDLSDSDLDQISGGFFGDDGGRSSRSSGITAGGEVLPRKRSKGGID